MSTIPVQPSYGVKLNNQKQVREHYEQGRDFDILSVVHGPGRKISKREAQEHGFALEIRYGENGEKVMVI